MSRKLMAKWGSVLGLVLLVISMAGGAEPVSPGLLPQGTVLRSVDGAIVRADSNDVWLFEVAKDVNEVDVQLSVGMRFELLPSVTLGDLLVDANDRVAPRYRLTGQVTQYQQTNFLLVGYYLPLSKLKDANEPGGPGSIPESMGVTLGAAGESSGDEMAIPSEILERLEVSRAVRGPKRRDPDKTAQTAGPKRVPNRVLVDTVGFIERRQDRWEFVPDALGRNVSEIRYDLLPCRALEQAEQRVAASPERIRFNVAGLVTGYQGKKYLLLQRVIRVYNHGNFGG